MKKLVTIFFLSSVLSVVSEESQPRVLEISSRSLPLNGKVTFYTGDGKSVTDDWKIEGKRFAWRAIPENSTEFSLSSLSDSSGRMALFADGNTFLPVNPARPIEPDSLKSGGIPERLPLAEKPRNYDLVVAGKTGKVFVGTLESEDDDSGWRTLYIVNASTLKKPDEDKEFTFAALKELVEDSEEKPEFVANFPLKVRPLTEGDGAGKPETVLRAGQRIRLEKLVPNGRSIYAEVTVQ